MFRPKTVSAHRTSKIAETDVSAQWAETVLGRNTRFPHRVYIAVELFKTAHTTTVSHPRFHTKQDTLPVSVYDYRIDATLFCLLRL